MNDRCLWRQRQAPLKTPLPPQAKEFFDFVSLRLTDKGLPAIDDPPSQLFHLTRQGMPDLDVYLPLLAVIAITEEIEVRRFPIRPDVAEQMRANNDDPLLVRNRENLSFDDLVEPGYLLETQSDGQQLIASGLDRYIVRHQLRFPSMDFLVFPFNAWQDAVLPMRRLFGEYHAAQKPKLLVS